MKTVFVSVSAQQLSSEHVNSCFQINYFSTSDFSVVELLISVVYLDHSRVQSGCQRYDAAAMNSTWSSVSRDLGHLTIVNTRKMLLSFVSRMIYKSLFRTRHLAPFSYKIRMNLRYSVFSCMIERRVETMYHFVPRKEVLQFYPLLQYCSYELFGTF